MAAAFEGWAILELMGHRRLAGHVSESTIAGGSFLRIDVPSVPPVTQFYAPGAVYAITPTTEDLARAFATRNAPAPVHAYELPAPRETVRTVNVPSEDLDVGEYGGEDDGDPDDYEPEF